LKSLFGVILLSVLILPFLGAFALLNWEKAQLRKELKWKMIEGIDKSELELLRFSIEQTKTELDWHHSHEFEYKGLMYDIVEIIQSPDSIHYYCWLDHDETVLNKRLDHVFYSFFGNGAPIKQKEIRVACFLRNLFLNSHQFQLPFTNVFKVELLEFYTVDLISGFLTSIDQPPEAKF